MAATLTETTFPQLNMAFHAEGKRWRGSVISADDNVILVDRDFEQGKRYTTGEFRGAAAAAV